MGASLVYLNEPNKEIEQESGSNQLMAYATGSMQGWRLNMVSDEQLIFQEDAHIVDLAFNNENNRALFGVFDGHGGREVAAYCGIHYGKQL